MSQSKKIYHAAIYVRLSKEDGDISNQKTESNSISNQKSLVKKFLQNKKDIKIVKEYVDDGYSGANFDRPGFQMMLADIKKGKINCVCIKDLSRFGREYINSGMYIERIFPMMGVRFISVNDNYDSVNNEENYSDIIIPFKNLLNDMYCRDISIKIRSQLEVKRKNGECILSFAPYGYKKSEEDRHKLIVDDYAAETVKEIYHLKICGMSQNMIAQKLNRKGILPPAEYKISQGLNYKGNFTIKDSSEWSSVMVRRILENEIYIGTLIQGKSTTPNHKVKKIIQKDPSEWIRIENNHEPIISKRNFELVQRLLKLDTRCAPGKDSVYPLSGLVVCGGCGMPMIRQITKCGGKSYSYYKCTNKLEKKKRGDYRISVGSLEKTVLELLKVQIKNIVNLKEIVEYIGMQSFEEKERKKLEEREHKVLHDIEHYSKLKGMLYSDWKDGILSEADYKEILSIYTMKKENLKKVLSEIKREKASLLKENNKFTWMNYFIQHRDIKELNREVAVSLIREIKIYAKKEIEIVFDFEDVYKNIIEMVEESGYLLKLDENGFINFTRKVV